MAGGSLRVAVVGLGFGEEFVPIYRDHPDVEEVIPVDTDHERLTTACKKHNVSSRFVGLDDVIASAEVDAVHLATSIPLHARQSIEVLRAGKHCACAVPMATTLADLEAVIAAQDESGSAYMMMETAVYTREFLYVKQLVETGELGRIQFLRGAHFQDMEGWPTYWMGLPPMYYATHAIGPLLALANTHASSVSCLGSGSMREQLHEPYGNPFPAETAIFRLAGAAAAAEVTRTLFDVAHRGVESFSVYGSRLSFEWQQTWTDRPLLYRLQPFAPDSDRGATWQRIELPDSSAGLPTEIAHYARKVITVEGPSGEIVELVGAHGGSHPHLVHEFVSAIVNGRSPYPSARVAARWTAAGICAHDSAMSDGTAVAVPSYLGQTTGHSGEVGSDAE
jgi:predicted dehydrogenase